VGEHRAARYRGRTMEEIPYLLKTIRGNGGHWENLRAGDQPDLKVR